MPLRVATDNQNTVVLPAHNETSAQTNHAIIAAPGAGYRIVVTRLLVSNGATAGTITFVEDPSGTPVQVGPVWYLAINGNVPHPVYWKLTTNKALGFTSATCTTHSVSVEYHIAAV
jgi:hypothetical protein